MSKTKPARALRFDDAALSGLMAETAARTLRVLSVASIVADPNQPRKEFNEATLIDMGESLAAQGQLQPIGVVELGGGRYQLVFGERRWRGATHKGLLTLEALVWPAGTDPSKVRRLQLVENLQRENMSALDTANGIKELVEAEGSAAAAARAISMSEAQISKYLAVLNLPPLTAALAEETGARNVETLTTLARVEREAPELAQQIAAEAQMTGQVARERVREAAKAVNERLKGKKNTAELFAGGRKAVQGADEDPAPRKPAKPALDSAGPAPVRLRMGHEGVAVSLRAVEGHRDAKRFNRARDEHGEPILYLSGVSQAAGRLWVMFGETDRARKDDGVPRLQEFPAAAVAIVGVRKFALASA